MVTGSMAYRLERPGSIAGLALVEEEVHSPGRGEVLVQIRASSINFHDLNVIEDAYADPSGEGPVEAYSRGGLVPLSDGAGEVVAIGAGVTRFAIGDRVLPVIVQDWIAGPFRPDHELSDLGGSLDGMLRHHAVVPQTGLVHVPAHLSFGEAAALSCAGVTAWNAVRAGVPLPGDRVLVQGTGGVSLFALQFARLFGARVIATTSSAQKAELLRELGAEHVVNYAENPAWGDEVVAATGGRGVDLVVETGGPTTLPQTLRALRIGGSISLVGFSGGIGEGFSPLPMLGKKLTMRAIRVGCRDDYEDMLRAVAAHELRPVIDRSFAFSDASQALQHFKARRHVGKVVIAHDQV